MPSLFQAEMRPARMLRQVAEALKEVVSEVQFECTDTGIIVQAMDSSHVSLVSLRLGSDGFQSYRCEKPMTLGVNVGHLVKILKCAGNDDTVLLAAEDGGDVLKLKLSDPTDNRVSDFAMKLIEIEGDQLGIPAQEYKASVEMNAGDFTKVVRDISSLGDTVQITVTKNGVSFAVSGDIGSINLQLKAGGGIPALPSSPKKAAKKEEPEEQKVKTEPGVKQEPGEKRKRTEIADDDDANVKKPRKGAAAMGPAKQDVKVTCDDTVSLQFALRYLAMFTKAAPCGETARLRMAKDVPLQVEFDVAGPVKDGENTVLGAIRYYLAPKVGDEDGAENAAGNEE
eukprot:Hpha_TRINITY_DN15891_c0_g4::TRINITY_DN15891_c0_g4_i1::g.189168::m.189168/K04802/PCNA; proliferating cell nuclear antigen